MLAARHKARLAMQDGNADSREEFPAAILRNSRVKRKLFADEEVKEHAEEQRALSDNQTNEFMEENRRHLEEARKKYNFNFETETPEPGKYVWEKVYNHENMAPKTKTDIDRETETHRNQGDDELAEEPTPND